MSVKRYVADADNTITNAFEENLSTRGTGSNMGESDILETFYIYAQASSASQEQSRILINFPVSSISSDRTNGKIPLNGSVNFILKMSNAPHSQTLPKKFTLSVQPISQSWTEGYGLDMENYTDLGVSNWIDATSTTTWTSEGGDYLTSSNYSQYFAIGNEDLETDITPLVEEWIAGTIPSDGVGVHLTSSEETGTRSFYTKMFFARGSEFYYKRPHIEARWDSAITDDRNDFVLSSSLLPAADNLNRLYLYNKFRGKLVNIPEAGTGSIYISMYSGTTAPVGSRLPLQGGDYVVTGGYVSTGIYSASVAVRTNVDQVFDVWHNNGGVEYFTGSAITLRDHLGASNDEPGEYITKITNLKSKYSTKETPRFNLYTRAKDWSPTVYTIATSQIENTTINNMYYKLRRVSDNYEIIPYGTGSIQFTKLSYDENGNYFSFDMSMLEAGYEYAFTFMILEYDEYKQQPEEFKFRVE